MALQRTRRPRFRSGRSLRSLGSPLNARSLGGFPHLPLLFLLLLSPASQLGAASEVRIEVSLAWDGLRPEVIGQERRQRGTWTVSCNHLGCRGPDGALPRERVDAFLAELVASPKLTPDLQDLGLTGEELNHVVKLAKEYPASSEHPEERRDAVGRFLLDPINLERIIREHYDPNTSTTDDYPYVSGKALWARREVEFSSNSQRFFMIPWTVKSPARTIKTYNAQMSRALATLLPPDFINLERLQDEWLHRWLVDQAWSAVNRDASIEVMPPPNMPLQRTRALAFARVRSLPPVARRSPLNAQPLGERP